MRVNGPQSTNRVLNLPADWNTTGTRRFAQSSARGDTPTSGLMRPGPVGINPPIIRRKGVSPVAMKIEKAQVDSQIESAEILDGKMTEPSGPYVVAWYTDTGKIGQDTNLVFAGHVDYYDVGEAVFFHLGDLAANDVVTLTGDDDDTYAYKIEWVKTYTQEQLDSTAVKEIVGATDTEHITLITCSGQFDFDAGIYHDRLVVRAARSS
jgi:sortase (surface protein transpeptidase)